MFACRVSSLRLFVSVVAVSVVAAAVFGCSAGASDGPLTFVATGASGAYEGVGGGGANVGSGGTGGNVVAGGNGGSVVAGGSGGNLAVGGSGGNVVTGGSGGNAVAGGTGGNTVSTGGNTVATGGNTVSTGGNTVGTGGNTVGTGGNTVSTGGNTVGTGGNVGTGGTVSNGNCTFTVSSSTSSKIPTVGIVEWSVDMSSVSSASIEFGLDTGYGMTAPVDLAEPNYRTLLLGMKASRTYHFRVVASGAGGDCTSGDYTVQTGALDNALRAVEVTTYNASALAGGFIVTSEWQSGPAYILDADGDYVWWYKTSTSDPSLTRARMSYDGKYMWMANNNNTGGQGELTKVTMDGLQEQRLSPIDHTHDLAVLPDGSIVLPEYSNMMGGGCGGIWERNAGTAHGGSSCHINSIHYFEGDDTITFSDTTQGCYVKLNRQGQVVWVLGGPTSDFSGNGADWSNGNHGHHVLAPDRLLIFNNGMMGAGSVAFEVQLDLNSMTATRVWEYTSGNTSNVLGDVQRLDNGNTLVTYSDSGIIHELDASNNLLQEITWQLGGALGYVNKRQSLYGPPPK
jgi:hypothetical protein